VARVAINGFEGAAILRNISIGGFCMESRTYAAITVGEIYKMNIQPESGSQVNSFDLEVEVRWVRSTETRFSAGLSIAKPPLDRSLARYIDYIAQRAKGLS
jgi:hypothetical protein